MEVIRALSSQDVFLASLTLLSYQYMTLTCKITLEVVTSVISMYAGGFFFDGFGVVQTKISQNLLDN